MEVFEIASDPTPNKHSKAVALKQFKKEVYANLHADNLNLLYDALRLNPLITGNDKFFEIY